MTYAAVFFHHMSWGWGVLMMLGWLFLLGLVVGVLYLTLRPPKGMSSGDPRRPPRAAR